MKKLGGFLFLLFCSLWEVQICAAHPLDVSNTTLSIYEDSIVGVTYIHPVELDRILIASGGVSPSEISVDMYYSLTGIVTHYLSQTIEAEVGVTTCTMGEFSFREELMIDEIFSGGFPISYVFRCSMKIIDPRITINFMTEVPLQTNKLYIYRSSGSEMVRTDYKVLNARKNNHSVSFSMQTQAVIDTDADGISDEDELLYRTDPENPDTDNDGYNDALEIEKSWNPLTSELSPGQYPYERDREESNISTAQVLTDKIPENTLSTDTGVWGGEQFRKILREIRLYVDGEIGKSSIGILLFSVMLLGFFHALGPGHSKGILVSQIIDEEMSYIKSVLYCGIFTFVHLLDIIIVVLLSKILFSFLDSSVYLSFVAKGSALLVIAVGLYLLVYSLRRYFSRKSEHSTSTKFRKQNYILMAIITGLTPCAFGWSIFLMLFALGKMSLALPLFFALGIGIFLCLFAIATVTWYSKNTLYSFSPKISRISPIISSVFVLIIGIGLTVQNF